MKDCLGSTTWARVTAIEAATPGKPPSQISATQGLMVQCRSPATTEKNQDKGVTAQPPTRAPSAQYSFAL